MNHDAETPGYRFDRLSIFKDGRHPLIDDREIQLNHSESAVLRSLAAGLGDYVSGDALRDAVGSSSKTPLKVIVSTLRRKLRENGADDNLVERGKRGAYRLSAQSIEPLPKDTEPPVPVDPSSLTVKLPSLTIDLEKKRIVSQAGDHALSLSALMVLREIAWAAPRFIDPDDIAAAIEDMTGCRPQRRAITFNVWQIRNAAREIGVHRLLDSHAKNGYRLARMA
mgnify:CR=1 FL=1